MNKDAKMLALTRAIRAAFNRLKALSDDLHGDAHITTAMRAVMEALDEAGPSTVPQIARAKGVTRQHIQLLTDALCEAGFAAPRDNPSHRRSSLIGLTEKGRRAFARMQTREEPVVAELASAFDAQEIERATAVLTRLIERIDERLQAETSA